MLKMFAPSFVLEPSCDICHDNQDWTFVMSHFLGRFVVCLLSIVAQTRSFVSVCCLRVILYLLSHMMSRSDLACHPPPLPETPSLACRGLHPVCPLATK